jgi:hypothetical protein
VQERNRTAELHVAIGDTDTPGRVAMTAISISRTTDSAQGSRRAARATGVAAGLERWASDRRRRRFLTEQRRHATRDHTDRYLDHPDEAHQRQVLAAFVSR